MLVGISRPESLTGLQGYLCDECDEENSIASFNQVKNVK